MWLCPRRRRWDRELGQAHAASDDGERERGRWPGPAASDAHGGGIWSARVATLTLEDSAVTGNASDVVAPNGRFAIGGGVHVGDGSNIAIDNTRINGNTVLVDDPVGQPSGFDAGMSPMACRRRRLARLRRRDARAET